MRRFLAFSAFAISLLTPIATANSQTGKTRAAKTWRVFPVSSLQKLVADSPGILRPFKMQPVELQAARGEWESCQIVVSAGDKPLRFRVEASSFATVLGRFIARENIQIYRENYVRVAKPSGNRVLEPLWWPDALIPVDEKSEFEIAANRSAVFWVAIHIPRDAEAGQYFAALDVTPLASKAESTNLNSADFASQNANSTSQILNSRGENASNLANATRNRVLEIERTPREVPMALQVSSAILPVPTMRANVALYFDLMRDWFDKNAKAANENSTKIDAKDVGANQNANAANIENSTSKAANNEVENADSHDAISANSTVSDGTKSADSSRNFAPLDDAQFAQTKRNYAEFLLDYGLNSYDLPVAWKSDDAANYLRDDRVLGVRLPPQDSPEFADALAQLRRTETLHKAYNYRIDEPSPDDTQKVRDSTQKLRAADANLKQAVTIAPNAALRGAVDIWCPNIGDFFALGHLDLQALERERNAGRETWFYTMVEPKSPYPTWLLDDDSSAIRVYSWLMARENLTGFVYSMAHGWGPKPLKNLESFAGTNGDGTLLYAGEMTNDATLKLRPIPSIRLMLLRDAIEDYELLRSLPRSKRRQLIEYSIPDNSLIFPTKNRAHFETTLASQRARLLQLCAGENAIIPTKKWPIETPTTLKIGDGKIPFATTKPKIDGQLNDASWNEKSRFRGEFARIESGDFPDFETQLWISHDDKFLYVALRGVEGFDETNVQKTNFVATNGESRGASEQKLPNVKPEIASAANAKLNVNSPDKKNFSAAKSATNLETRAVNSISREVRAGAFTVEIAPIAADKRWRFVSSASGKSSAEFHTREGHFVFSDADFTIARRVENQVSGATETKFEYSKSAAQNSVARNLSIAAKNSQSSPDKNAVSQVEMAIPLRLLGGAKRFRLNAWRRVWIPSLGAFYTVRAFPDANDTTRMPFVDLGEKVAPKSSAKAKN